jgi:dinuclear metal center YbgI/SA1388 family protein
MKIKEITDFLETIAPLEYQERYDNAGLIVGDINNDFKGALICLDSTEEVVDEAIDLGYNFIIAHHPIIFQGIKKLTGKTYIGRTILKAIKNDIAIYAMHTNLDNAFLNGVSTKIANKLGFENLEILDPKPEFLIKNQQVGTGVIANLENEMEEMEFLNYLKEKLKLNCIKYTSLRNKPVRKVAICGGACSFLLKKAKYVDADVFVTADFKYHEFFDAEKNIIIADIGHYESEIYTIELIFDILKNNFSNFAAQLTKVITNPVKYL